MARCTCFFFHLTLLIQLSVYTSVPVTASEVQQRVGAKGENVRDLSHPQANSSEWNPKSSDIGHPKGADFIIPENHSINLNSTGWIIPRNDSTKVNSSRWNDFYHHNATGWIIPRDTVSHTDSAEWKLPRNDIGRFFKKKKPSHVNSTGWIIPRGDTNGLNSTGWIIPRNESSSLNLTGWIIPRNKSNHIDVKMQIIQKSGYNGGSSSSTSKEHPKRVGCGRHVISAGKTYEIQTKNFPRSYPRWYRGCNWLFKATEDTELKLSCRDFRLPLCRRGSQRSKRRCYKTNFLLLRDRTGKNLHRYRGNNGPKDVSIFGQEFSLILRLSAPSRGFLCSVKAVPIPQEITTSDPSTCDFACGLGPTKLKDRIVGGAVSASGRWPWVGGLVPMGTRDVFCGTTLVHPNWAVTAAHCAALVQSENADVDILLGAFDLDRPTKFEQRRKIAAIHIHKDYNNYTLNNDIALLHLGYPITITNKVGPICLASLDTVHEGVRATVAGWGLNQEVVGALPATVLHEAQVDTVPYSSCKEIYEENLFPAMFCAGGGLKDACKGDSGGGLMWLGPKGRWEVLGIVSWGRGCGRPGFPGVYASVKKFIPWIKTFTDNSNCDSSHVTNSKPHFKPTTTTTKSTTKSSSQVTKKCQCGRVYNRIVGGVETGINEFPWHVGLIRSGGVNPFCGASIISRRHVLTAAHCTKAIQDNGWRVEVLVGGHHISSNSNTPLEARIPMDSIIQHPGYDASTLRNDISIVKMAADLDLDANPRLAPVCLPTPEKSYVGAMAVVSGWGRLSEGGTQPQLLQKVWVPVMTNEACRFSYRGAIFPESLCAGYPEGKKDACQGDSGGPLTTEEDSRMVQIGVVSWGAGCARPGKPGVYARVSKYLDWIKGVTGSEDPCA